MLMFCISCTFIVISTYWPTLRREDGGRVDEEIAGKGATSHVSREYTACLRASEVPACPCLPSLTCPSAIHSFTRLSLIQTARPQGPCPLFNTLSASTRAAHTARAQHR